MVFKREVVINFENQRVDSHLCQLPKILAQCFKVSITVVVEKVHSVPWLRAPGFEPAPGLTGPRRDEHQKQNDEPGSSACQCVTHFRFRVANTSTAASASNR